ncbi:hypothetical protein [Tessaracoccus defluvii]|uniref:Uncharacterized protein n=1 Tax=Tessaracoccus defluvii TaxID=1285901 RepID=A0A7H0H5W8_9ACTN|nr:hypothetical protein [Tessaracoccus defluvii]QNP55934.1 hypothetical protein H9L22_17885 [Tessaracoccus defluvii]
MGGGRDAARHDGAGVPGPRGLNGDVYFWVRVNETVDESTEIEYTFGSVTTEVTVTPPVAPCTDDCDFEWGYWKGGSIDYENNIITWWVQVNAEEGGMRGGEVVKVLDIPDQNQELILTENCGFRRYVAGFC